MSYYDLSEHITLPNAAMKPAILVRERGLVSPPSGPKPPSVVPTSRGPISSGGVMGTPDQPAQRAPLSGGGTQDQPAQKAPSGTLSSTYTGGVNSPAVRNRTPVPGSRGL